MDAQLKAALAAALGSGIASARGIAGGDINRAYEVALADGRRLFVKTNDRSPRGMFAAEARGLGWLGEAGALRIPKVVAVVPGVVVVVVGDVPVAVDAADTLHAVGCWASIWLSASCTFWPQYAP